MSDDFEAIDILLEKYEQDLNEWEHGFLTDLQDRKARDMINTLTAKQMEKVNEIWFDIVEKGRAQE